MWGVALHWLIPQILETVGPFNQPTPVDLGSSCLPVWLALEAGGIVGMWEGKPEGHKCSIAADTAPRVGLGSP